MLSGADSYLTKFRDLTDEEINDYIKRNPILKFSGGFDDQGRTRFCEKVKGSYPFSTGLPMQILIKFLRENKVNV